jgi:hypothetical protein
VTVLELHDLLNRMIAKTDLANATVYFETSPEDWRVINQVHTQTTVDDGEITSDLLLVSTYN